MPPAALWRLRAERRIGAMDVTVAAEPAASARECASTASASPPTRSPSWTASPSRPCPRTLFDLAAVLDARQVERALNEADYLRLADRLSLPDLLARHPRRAGAVKLRAALAAAQLPGPPVTRSELEERFIRLLDDAGLPRPQTNTLVPGVGRWIAPGPSRGSSLELDSRAAHATPAAFETDRERDRVLQTAGWRVVRVTWRQLTERPGAPRGRPENPAGGLGRRYRFPRTCPRSPTPGRSAATGSRTASCWRRWRASATGSCASRPSASAPAS